MDPVLHSYWSWRGQSSKNAIIICSRESNQGELWAFSVELAIIMGEATSGAFRIAFQVIATFLFLGFLLTAVGGIVLKTSTHALQSIVTTAVKGYEGGSDDVRQITAFLIETPDAIATCCIMVGAVLAVIAQIGLIASYCGWNKMLKIVSLPRECEIGPYKFINLLTYIPFVYQYALIPLVLLVAQTIGVAVIFSNPTKFANEIASSAEELLKSYRNRSEEGNKSTTTWDVLMKV
ncbi:hypothetical protein TSMEX_009824 [Taenia solium]|eukprot:TsM_000184100 transcript=TsM_000184100 gene=TsM_000184100